MQQFVFVGPQGSFTVPPGESRIGSDAACQICIRGEGVLPIHAYLRSDGEKLLIRPADSSSAILVNNKPLSGPANLSGGNEIALGGVQMRVLASAVKLPPLTSRLWNKTWFRRCTWTAVSAAALLVLAYCVLIYVVLNESTLKEHIRQSISTHFLRDDAEIESVTVNPFEGVLQIKNLHFRERDNFAHAATEKDRYRLADGQAPFISIPGATARVEVWPLIRSWFRDYRSLTIEIRDPLITIERAKADGALNIGDIVRKYSQARSRIVLPMEELDGRLTISNGKIRLVDNFTNIGETSLEEIHIKVSQPGAGRPLVIEQCGMKVNAKDSQTAKGELNLTGNLSLIDQACTIDTAAIASEDLKLDMKAFDLARIFEHLGYSWSPYAMNFKVVLGKPVNGHLDLKMKNPQNLRLAGKVQSESLLSIKEGNLPPIGNIPMGLDFDIALTDNGRGYIPSRINHVNLRSGTDLNDPASIHLLFDAQGGTNLNNNIRDYTVSLECILQDLLGTDVGKRLNLAGRLGGRLQGNARFIRESNGSWKIDTNIEGKDTYVMISDPSDEKKPPVRQPLPMNFAYHASAQPNAAGDITELVLDRFNVKAPSLVASSEVPGMIKLDQKGELEAQAQFKLALRGKQFWSEFKPILDLFGLTQPVEETFDMKITAVGSNDIIKVVAKGNASRQWDPDPSPVELETYLEFNRKAAAKPGAAGSPYLAMMLEVASSEAKPLYIRIDGHRSRDDKSDTLTLERLGKEGEAPQPGLVIKSDIVTLRERFRPYVEGYLQSRDGAHNSTWQKLYKETQLSGQIEHSGRVVFKQMIDPRSQQPDVFDFDMRVAGKGMAVNMPMRSLLDDKPESPGFKWKWSEEAATFGLKGQFRQRLSENKEEPNRERLDIERLEVKGSVGAFQLSMKDLDLFKLTHLRSLRKQTWTDCVAALTMAGQIDPPAYDLARSLQVLPQNNPLAGGLSLQISYDREKDALEMQKFAFKQQEKRPNAFLQNLDASGSLLKMRELSARLFPTELDAAPFAEQLESFITDGGPAALLDHLGDELALNTLQVDADAFSEWVRQDYKDAKQPPQLFKSILNGDFKPAGIWKAAAVRISRNDPKVRKWQLVGAFRNDFSIYEPQPLNGKRPVAFSFGHEWALRMGAAVSQNDNTVAIEVDEAILDKADIFAALPAFKYDYIKPAGEPCKIELAQCLYSHGLLAQVGRFKLSGKPVSLEVKDLNANWTRVKSGSYQVAEVLINGGPMPCALIVGNYEPGSDILNARISAPTADLMYLTSVRRLPSSLQVTGQLKNLSASYKGSLIALQAIIEPDAAALLKRFPDLKPDDPRLHGLNPDTDAIEIDCTLKDVVLNALSLNGERLKVQTGGQIRLTSRDLAWKNCAVQTEYRTPTYAVAHGFSGASLMVNSADPKSSLAKAYRAPGVPVNVNGDIAFETPLNVAPFMSAHDLLFAAFAGKQAAAPEKERRFTDFQNFVFTGNFKAPSIILGDTVLPPIDTQGVTLKSLKLSVPVLPLDLAGGKLVFSDADFDASKAALFREDGKLAIKGVSFRTRLKLTDADLAKLLGGTAKGAYGIGGRVEAQGNLEGTNFSGADRLSWAGAVKFRLSNLALIAPSQPWSAENIAPWSAAFAELGPQVFAAFTKAASNDTSNVQELAKDFPGDPGLKPASGLALALQVYLAKTCGVENERLDFDAITPTIVIDKGQASIDPFLLVGTGKCQGLELQIRNVKMNLADEAFADEMMLYPVLIPTAAMERLYFSRWPGPEQAQYKVDLREGKLPMRIYGRLSAPTVKYPWQELRALGTRALFGRPAIHDLASLEAARAEFTKNWGALETDMKAAAAVGDRLGIGFPATITCRNQGHSVIDRVPGLPQSLVSKLSVSSPTISPFESLNALLHPEPDPAAQSVPLPPNKTPAPKPEPKQN